MIKLFEKKISLIREVDKIKIQATRRRRIYDFLLSKPFYTISEEIEIDRLVAQAAAIQPEIPKTFAAPSGQSYVSSQELSLMLGNLREFEQQLAGILPQALALLELEQEAKRIKNEQIALTKANREVEKQAREVLRSARLRAIEEKRQETDRRAREQVEMNAALAAGAAGKTRKRAQSIRFKLQRNDDIYESCTYCGLKYDKSTAQADHIYPVSHGGLSTEQNMVLVCRECNSRKTNLTLREFIEKYPHICRTEVEHRLTVLKKRF